MWLLMILLISFAHLDKDEAEQVVIPDERKDVSDKWTDVGLT